MVDEHLGEDEADGQHGRRHDEVAADEHAATRDERMAVAGPFGHVLGETIGTGIEGS